MINQPDFLLSGSGQRAANCAALPPVARLLGNTRGGAAPPEETATAAFGFDATPRRTLQFSISARLGRGWHQAAPQVEPARSPFIFDRPDFFLAGSGKRAAK